MHTNGVFYWELRCNLLICLFNMATCQCLHCQMIFSANIFHICMHVNCRNWKWYIESMTTNQYSMFLNTMKIKGCKHIYCIKRYICIHKTGEVWRKIKQRIAVGIPELYCYMDNFYISKPCHRSNSATA